MRRIWTAMIGGVLAGVLAGCPAVKKDSAEREVSRAALQAEKEQCARDVNEYKAEASRLKDRLNVLEGFDADKAKYMVYPASAAIGRFTRGYDTDHDGIDDGVVVYLELKDREGDVMKAAGKVEIELWDLEAEAAKSKIGSWVFPLEQLQKYWLSGVMADHYRFELGWPGGAAPRHKNVTVKARFYCALTGNVIEIQQMVEVKAKS